MTPPVLAARRAGLYLRVSTATKSRRREVIAFEQDPAVQERPLSDLITQRGWTVYRVYSDRLSGAKDTRTGLNALMADARRGAFDVVVVRRFDRFAWQRQTACPGAGGIPLPGNRLHFAPGGFGHLHPPWAARCSPSSRPWRSWNATSSENGAPPASNMLGMVRNQESP